ncbi:adenylate kinase [Fragilaria crotonensis]|nr:adenylate kinase [Fragilaria crotonensis]
MSGRLAWCPNISLIGPPGSGKGSYGRLLAEFLSLPLITVSTLLQQAQVDTSSGKLVDDETVSKILVPQLPKHQSYLLDGFPRTASQVKLMERDWDAPVQAAISLEVPRQVCLEKLLGRRICTICNRNWNIANVQYGSFNLPASLPESCISCSSPTDHWVQRADDTPAIIERRLDTFYASSQPILDHYEANGKLLRFAPFQGYLDMPRFKLTVANWLGDLDPDLVS